MGKLSGEVDSCTGGNDELCVFSSFENVAVEKSTEGETSTLDEELALSGACAGL
jgi:hypothetical protein